MMTSTKLVEHRRLTLTRAWEAFRTDPERFAWLLGDRPGRYRPMILAKLGRISNREDLLVAALDCCELRPPTGEAVRVIRDWRVTHRRIGTNRCEKSGRSAVRSSVQLNPSGRTAPFPAPGSSAPIRTVSTAG